jgi:hypothetical protein
VDTDFIRGASDALDGDMEKVALLGLVKTPQFVTAGVRSVKSGVGKLVGAGARAAGRAPKVGGGSGGIFSAVRNRVSRVFGFSNVPKSLGVKPPIPSGAMKRLP